MKNQKFSILKGSVVKLNAMAQLNAHFWLKLLVLFFFLNFLLGE